MDTEQNSEGEGIDPRIVIELQQEQIASLMHDNIMLGALARQRKGEITSLTDLIAQKGERDASGE